MKKNGPFPREICYASGDKNAFRFDLHNLCSVYWIVTRCEVKGSCVKMERIVQLLIHEFYFAGITCLERLCEHAFRLLGRRFVVTLRLKHHLQHNWQVHLIWMTDANTEAHRNRSSVNSNHCSRCGCSYFTVSENLPNLFCSTTRNGTTIALGFFCLYCIGKKKKKEFNSSVKGG